MLRFRPPLVVLVALTAAPLLAARAAGQELLPSPPSAAETINPPAADVVDSTETVVSIKIEGNATIPTEQITAQLMTRVGRQFDPDTIRRDVRHLYRQGWFVDVRPFSQPTDRGRVVIFRVKERPTIRYVEILGCNKISKDKLKKQIGLKVGDAIDPYRVEDARRQIEEFYKGKGFNRVQVFIKEGTELSHLGVVFEVNEGQSERIWSVKFVGNEFVSDRRLKTQIQSKPGILWVFKGKVNPEQIKADAQRLEDYYRAFGYFHAKVSPMKDFNDKGNWLTLTFVIHEGPRYTVRNIRFIGNGLFGSEALANALQLKVGEPFDRLKLNRDREWLREVYGSEGYVYADIKPNIRFLDGPGELPGELDLVYEIIEGKQWRVGRVFVHIGGDNPHTRRQVAISRLSLRPGDILDTREIQASEIRLQRSGLFETKDPSRAPRIRYQIPELNRSAEDSPTRRPNPRRASQPSSSGPPASPRQPGGMGGFGGGGFRGQSPDPGLTRQPTTATRVDSRGVLDVHAHFADERQFRAWQSGHAHSSGASNHTAAGASQGRQSRRVLPAYRHLFDTAPARPANPAAQFQQHTPPAQLRYSRPLQQAAHSMPTVRGQDPTARPAFGGTAIGATGPDVPGTVVPQNPQRVAQIPGPLDSTQPLSGSIAPFFPSPGTPRGGLEPIPIPPLVGGLEGPLADVVIEVDETQTGRFQLGVGVNSDAGVIGNVVIDERNFDWRKFPTSWADLPNAFRGGGQRLRI